LIREQQEEITIFERISHILRKALPDVGRFIYIYDYIRVIKKRLKKILSSIIEYLEIIS
jgi:hypothetical protein